MFKNLIKKIEKSPIIWTINLPTPIQNYTENLASTIKQEKQMKDTDLKGGNKTLPICRQHN